MVPTIMTMDLQVVLLAPRVFANANYYKTKLYWHDFTIYNLSNRDVVCYCHDFTIYNLSNGDVVCYCHDFTIYNLSNRDVVCYFWHEMNGELKNSNFASCIFGSSRVSGG